MALQTRADERKQEALAVAQTKQDEGLKEGSGDGKERKLFLPQATPTDGGRDAAGTPAGWL